MSRDISADFAKAFQEAGGTNALSYNGLVRFMAIMFVILAVLWVIVHFMGEDAKASDLFLVTLGSRLVRLVIGLTLFIGLLMTGGS